MKTVSVISMISEVSAGVFRTLIETSEITEIIETKEGGRLG